MRSADDPERTRVGPQSPQKFRDGIASLEYGRGTRNLYGNPNGLAVWVKGSQSCHHQPVPFGKAAEVLGGSVCPRRGAFHDDGGMSKTFSRRPQVHHGPETSSWRALVIHFFQSSMNPGHGNPARETDQGPGGS